MKLKTTIAQIAGSLAVGGVGVAVYASLVRPWHLRWGATRVELGESLPGDELVPHPMHQATHAITIQAPVADVWPWLAQMGQTKGGFYSYEWLENLIGCHIHNAERIVPEWQDIQGGDEVWLHPKAPPLPVILVEARRAIVLGSAVAEEPSASAGTWGFYLREIDPRTTRLLIRIRWERNPSLLNLIASYVLMEPAHFIMERKMMLGIKERAETAVSRRGEELKRVAAFR